MSITLTLPESEEDIPAALTKLRAELAAAQTRVNAIRGAIEAVQSTCSHRNKSHGRDGYGDGSWTRCGTCQKEW